MDIVSAAEALTKGGPTVLFLILAAVIFWQHHSISELKKRIDHLNDEFMKFQLSYAETRVRKEDLAKVVEMIEKANNTNSEALTKIIERMDDHATRFRRYADLERDFRRTGVDTRRE
ncbi:MAG: hypothetical protein HQL74_07500 [Magnetococcales bacterium]|nr:hypothetical protein [Magnetococcales bacterium]